MAPWVKRLWLRIRATASSRVSHEIHDELQLHVQLLEEEYERQGMAPDEARRRARLEFGNLTQLHETSHELFSYRPLTDLLQDARYALRQIRHNISFTLVAVFSLAIGIGAVTTAFAIVDAFLLRRLPVHDPGRLVALSTSDADGWRFWTYASFVRWRDSPDARLDVAASSDVFVVPVRGAEPVSLRVSVVSGNYFQLMGVDMAIGRAFTASEDRPPAAIPIAVISDALWRRWFSGAPDVEARTLDLNGVTFQIAGVARAPFTGDTVGHPSDVWIPISMVSAVVPDSATSLEDVHGTGRRWLRVLGRPHPGVPVAQAVTSVNLIHQRFDAERASALGATHPDVVRSRKQLISLLSAANGYAPERGRYAVALRVFVAVTTLLLLVACANFTNLMLARSQSRRKEFAIRLALGGGRWRLIRQAMMECVVLAFVAGGLGLLIASWATNATLTYFAVMIQPIELDFVLDMRVVAFAAGCVGLVIAFGFWPCIRPARAAAVSLMAQAPLTVGARPRRRAPGWRVVLIGQLALCTALLVGAGLFLRTVSNLRSQDLGFDRNVLLVSVSSTHSAPDGPAAAMLVDRVIERLVATPGIQAAGASGPGLLESAHYWIDRSQQLTTDRGAVVGGIQWTSAAVGPGFFGAVGMRLVHGREFDRSDADAEGGAVVINQSLATLLFGRENPIGRRIGLGPKLPRRVVIGVVNDARQTSPRDRGMGVVYVPFVGGNHLMLAVRTNAPASEAVALVRHQLHSIESGLRVESVRPIAEVLDEAIARERLMSVLSSVLCGLVVLVGCVGLYALMAYDVGQQTPELGIRLALGATRRSVIAMILRQSAWLVVPGLAVGLPLGILAMRPLAGQLYGVGPADPVLLLSVMAVVAGVALVATWRPASSASRIDPATLLRSE